MRGIYGLILSVGLAVLLIGTTAYSQNPAKPMAIQIVIGADGSVKVINAKTGKEIDASVIKRLMKPGAIDAKQFDKKKIDQLRKALDKAIEAEFNKPRAEPRRPAVKPIEIELELRPQPKPSTERPKVIQIEKIHRVGDPATLDKKLDLILKQLGELRKDVDGITKRLDGKKPNNLQLWQLVPQNKNKKPGVIEFELVPAKPNDARPAAPQLKFKLRLAPGKDAGKDKKAESDPAIRKALEYLRRKQVERPMIPANPEKLLNREVIKRLNDLIKQLEENGAKATPRPPMPTEAQRIEELQRSLERIRQEIDALKKSK